jgi:hypothetical protein
MLVPPGVPSLTQSSLSISPGSEAKKYILLLSVTKREGVDEAEPAFRSLKKACGLQFKTNDVKSTIKLFLIVLGFCYPKIVN